MIWDYQNILSRRLLLWGFLSLISGLCLAFFAELSFWNGFGIQIAAWGLIDCLIAGYGLHRVKKNGTKLVNLIEVNQEAKKLKRILWINAAADIFYLGFGSWLILGLGRTELFWAGSGWGIILQGGFLLFFDCLHALATPNEKIIEDLGLFNHDRHESYFFDGGKGAVLLVHGFPGSPHEMRSLGEAIHRFGWTVKGIQLPGFGKDFPNLFQKREKEWEDAIFKTYKELEEHYYPIVILGYSMGGGLAIPVASKVNPKGLILLAPFWIPELIQFRPFIQFARLFLPISFRPFRWMKFKPEEMKSAMIEMVPEFDPNSVDVQKGIRELTVPLIFLEQFYQLSKQVVMNAARLSVSALIIQPADDPVVYPKNTNQLRKLIKSPVSYVEVPGEHDVNYPSHPGYALMLKQIIRYLDQVNHSS